MKCVKKSGADKPYMKIISRWNTKIAFFASHECRERWFVWECFFFVHIKDIVRETMGLRFRGWIYSVQHEYVDDPEGKKLPSICIRV